MPRSVQFLYVLTELSFMWHFKFYVAQQFKVSFIHRECWREKDGVVMNLTATF